MAQQPKHWMDEPDIGSGEKAPSQADVEGDEHSIGATSPESGTSETAKSDGTDTTGRVLQSGTHLARILATKQPDGRFEAQVYVRLTREPETAETYIPAGTFMTEAEAWRAAEERAQRAFREHEF